MSGSTTNVPGLSFTATGVSLPDEADIYAGVMADVNAAFGGGMNITNPETPQGQLGTSFTAIIGDKNANVAYLASQFDPNNASGAMQDGLARLYFLERDPATATTVAVTINGLGGTIPPGWILAIDLSQGYTYATTAAVVVPGTGAVSATLACTTTGPITCAPNALTIYQTRNGVDQITNSEGVIGSLVESQSAFETRRRNSVAINAVGVNDAIFAKVLAVPDVVDAYVIDNPSSAANTIGGVSIPANALYVSVSGGTTAAIAQAILSKRPPGSPMAGNTTVTATSTNTAYAVPPTYPITFQVATAVPIFYQVTILNSTAVPSNALALVQAAIVSAFAGGDGGPRARIGGTLLASRMYSPVIALGTWAQVVDIYIGTAASPTGNSASVNISQIPTIAPANITLVLQ